MNADMIAALIGLAVFAALVGGWLWIGAAWDRVGKAEAERLTQRKLGAGRFIGGRDRLGE